MPKQSIYTTGGTVQASGGIYIPRKADDELLELCRSGTFAYVLTPRQMGKSSLMVRTADRLANDEIASVIIDLSLFGVHKVTAVEWYMGLVMTIADSLLDHIDVVKWWQDQSHLGITQRFSLFLQKLLLAEIKGHVVIFIDEIDTTLDLTFRDDFFALIRYMHNARSTIPEFRRLSFVLIGVATPSDLISDSKRTPFNIGRRVDLTDFTFEEASPLTMGLGFSDEKSKFILKSILEWTGGHPYLTQKMCAVFAQHYKEKRLLKEFY